MSKAYRGVLKARINKVYGGDVTVNKWDCDDQLFGYLDTNCEGWY